MKNQSDDTIVSVIIRSVDVTTRSVKVTNYVSPITILLVAAVSTFIYMFNRRRSHMVRLMAKIPGPPALPIIGNTIESNVDHDGNIFA